MTNPWGVTLVELLVTIAVLALVVVILSQIVTASSATVQQSKRVVDTSSQARAAFELIGEDLSQMVFRADVPAEFAVATGDKPFMRVITEVQGPTDDMPSTRSLSQVGYRVSAQKGLERASLPILWSQSIFKNADFDDLSTAIGTLVDADYDGLAPGVVKVAVRFLNDDGGVVSKWPGVAKARAVSFTLAIVDRESLKLIHGPGVLADAFGAGEDSKTPRVAWTKTANGVVKENVPRAAATSVRIYERLFSLPEPLVTEKPSP